MPPEPTPPVTPVVTPTGPVTPVVPATPAVTPVPAVTPAQPTPAAPKPGEPSPGGEPKPEPQTVPIGALLDERNKRQAMEAELALLRQGPAQAAPMPPSQQPGPNDQYKQYQQEVDRLWETDPRKAVETTVNSNIMMAIDWYDKVNGSLDTQADVLAGKYSDFNTHRSAAMKYTRGLPPQQRAQQGVLEMAYYIVRGQNVDDLLKQQNDDLMQKFQTGQLAAQVSSPAGAYSAPAAQPGLVLSDEQRTAANAMGLTEEQYASQIKLPPKAGV